MTVSRPSTTRWPVRAFNTAARGLEWCGIRRRLRADEVLAYASRLARLTDFGPGEFREPLDRLIADYEESSQLHPFGRLGIFIALVRCAMNRLWLQDAWQRHPETLQLPPVRPLYVIGMPRTGTTLLYNLLCQDPEARPLYTWESMYPARPAKDEYRGLDRRLRKARENVGWMNYLAPSLKAIHAIDPAGPEECGWLLNNTFISLLFLADGYLPNYRRYYQSLPADALRQSYDYYARTLQLLQNNDARHHWVLKAPVHLAGVGALLEVMPQAHVIFTHREPTRALASACSLLATTRRVLSDRVDPQSLGPELLEQMSDSWSRAEKTRARFRQRMTDVVYDQLVRDPIRVIRHIYAEFGLPYSNSFEERMQNWILENPSQKHGQHHYHIEEYGLTEDLVQQRFGEYWSRYQELRRHAA